MSDADVIKMSRQLSSHTFIRTWYNHYKNHWCSLIIMRASINPHLHRNVAQRQVLIQPYWTTKRRLVLRCARPFHVGRPKRLRLDAPERKPMFVDASSYQLGIPHARPMFEYASSFINSDMSNWDTWSGFCTWSWLHEASGQRCLHPHHRAYGNPKSKKGKVC